MLRVDGERLWSSLMAMGEIGGTPAGGCHRLALTEEDGRARALLRRWAEEAGCAVTVDAIGNMFARRAGTEPDAAPIAIGSHLDTVPMGGKFDGPYGVLAGLEVLRRLNDLGIETRRPIELVNWTNEEGSRFSPSTMGSLVHCGALELDVALSRRDKSGISVQEALHGIGHAGERSVGHTPFAAYLETHIEQGGLLKRSGDRIGIVTGSFRARYFLATIKGEANHVGTTLMDHRHDAMAGAAALVLEIERIGRSHGWEGRSNAPYIELDPNVRGVIPKEVRLACDVRHADPATALGMETELHDACRRIAEERGLTIDLDPYFAFGPITCDETMTSLVRDTAEALGIPCRDMLTVATHDAVPMMDVCPTVLFFITSETGISHNEAEYSTPQQCRDGADVLLNAALKLAS